MVTFLRSVELEGNSKCLHDLEAAQNQSVVVHFLVFSFGVFAVVAVVIVFKGLTM